MRPIPPDPGSFDFASFVPLTSGAIFSFPSFDGEKVAWLGVCVGSGDSSITCAGWEIAGSVLDRITMGLCFGGLRELGSPKVDDGNPEEVNDVVDALLSVKDR